MSSDEQADELRATLLNENDKSVVDVDLDEL